MNIIQRDILTVERGIICQQVNCRGVMGAGLAKAIADKWPVVKSEYLKYWDKETDHYMLLGHVNVVDISERLMVANIFSQDTYGRNGCHTRYVDLGRGLRLCKRLSSIKNLPVYIPYGIGCGLAGGDWQVVSALIEQELLDAIVCKKP